MMDTEYSFECSMCGKPMSYRHCGMCVECEQINDDVPEEPVMDYSVNGLCPQCGSGIKEQQTGGGCGEHFQYCDSVNCAWSSVTLYDC
jgi:hypothetical protein